jgi:hypothetical protein
MASVVPAFCVLLAAAALALLAALLALLATERAPEAAELREMGGVSCPVSAEDVKVEGMLA